MYAVLHISTFSLQAVLRTEPSAARQPAALFTGGTKKSCVLEANPSARNAGVEVGMTAPQAVARCPALVIRTPNAEAEADARAALLAVGFTLSPSIEDTAPGVCTADIKGAAPAVRPRAARAAVWQLEALGFTATAGIGSTPLLALYAARKAGGPGALVGGAPATPWATQQELPLGVAEDPLPAAAPPDDDPRVLVVSDPVSFLAPLPLAAADPAPDTAGVFASWGIRTLGQLTALSRDDVGRRLGPDALALWDRARGGSPRPLHLVAPGQTFEAEMEFEDEVQTLEPLLFILRRFLDRLTLELRTTGYVAATLKLTLNQSDDTPHEREFRLPEPTADAEILFRTLFTHLEALRTDAGIVAVHLHIDPARPLVRQQGLFDTGLRDPHGFSETLARVVAIAGSDQVGTPQLEDSHRPDAINLSAPPAVIPPAAAPPVHPAIGLPLRRYRPPLPAQLELTQGRPTYLWTPQFSGAIAEVQGPWLGSGDWWETGRSWRRTEYDVSLAGGGLYRLIYCDQGWFVEGEYD